MPFGLPVSLQNHLGEAHSDQWAVHDVSIGPQTTDQEGDDGLQARKDRDVRAEVWWLRPVTCSMTRRVCGTRNAVLAIFCAKPNNREHDHDNRVLGVS